VFTKLLIEGTQQEEGETTVIEIPACLGMQGSISELHNMFVMTWLRLEKLDDDSEGGQDEKTPDGVRPKMCATREQLTFAEECELRRLRLELGNCLTDEIEFMRNRRDRLLAAAEKDDKFRQHVHDRLLDEKIGSAYQQELDRLEQNLESQIEKQLLLAGQAQSRLSELTAQVMGLMRTVHCNEDERHGSGQVGWQLVNLFFSFEFFFLWRMPSSV